MVGPLGEDVGIGGLEVAEEGGINVGVEGDRGRAR